MAHLPHPAGGGLFGGFVPVDLLLPGKDPVFAKATLASGVAYKAGSVLGRITAGAVTQAYSGTGNGVLTLDATSPKRLGAKAGAYKVTCIAAAANGGTFRVEDPDGYVLGDVAVGATFDDDIKFAIADGATDFVVGDVFTITVAAGSNKLKLAAAAAEDGSAVPMAILLEDVDATGADKNIQVAVEGYFNEESLIFGAGHTADTVRVPLRQAGIHIKGMNYSVG